MIFYGWMFRKFNGFAIHEFQHVPPLSDNYVCNIWMGHLLTLLQIVAFALDSLELFPKCTTTNQGCSQLVVRVKEV
jgi:hypothetical protein